MADIFISYDQQDWLILGRVARDLQALKHAVRLEPRFTGRQAQWDRILAMVRDCSVFVLVLSREALQSETCRLEYSYAIMLRKPVIPVLVADDVAIGDLPPELSKIDWVDYRQADRKAASRLGWAVARSSNDDHPHPLPDPLPKPPDAPKLHDQHETFGAEGAPPRPDTRDRSSVLRDSVGDMQAIGGSGASLSTIVKGAAPEPVQSRGLGGRLKKLWDRFSNKYRTHAEKPRASAPRPRVPPTRAGGDVVTNGGAATEDRSSGLHPEIAPEIAPEGRTGRLRPEIAPEIAPEITPVIAPGGRDWRSRPEIAPEIAPQVVDEVDATVYAPNQAAPGDNFLVLVYAHLPSQAAAVEEEAKAVAPDVKKRFRRTLDEKITRGAQLRFDLTMPGLEIDEPSQSLVWQGKHDSVQFSITVPPDSKPSTVVGTVIVSKDTVPVGHLKFTLGIVAGVGAVGDRAAALSPEPVQAGSLIPYKWAFISYASADRAEVLKRVQMLNASKVNFFQDLLTLQPGQQWEKLIYEYIDRSDVFFLFWSKAASESRWVRKEIEYAKARKRENDETPPEFVPIIIEGPPPAKPPKDLSFLHFNDQFTYFIKVEEDLR